MVRGSKESKKAVRCVTKVSPGDVLRTEEGDFVVVSYCEKGTTNFHGFALDQFNGAKKSDKAQRFSLGASFVKAAESDLTPRVAKAVTDVVRQSKLQGSSMEAQVQHAIQQINRKTHVLPKRSTLTLNEISMQVSNAQKQPPTTVPCLPEGPASSPPPKRRKLVSLGVSRWLPPTEDIKALVKAEAAADVREELRKVAKVVEDVEELGVDNLVATIVSAGPPRPSARRQASRDMD